jgi:hypothetical protein
MTEDYHSFSTVRHYAVLSQMVGIAEDRAQSWASACEICGGQSGTGKDFSPSSSVFLCHIILPMFLTHIPFIYYRRYIALSIYSVVK